MPLTDCGYPRPYDWSDDDFGAPLDPLGAADDARKAVKEGDDPLVEHLRDLTVTLGRLHMEGLS